MWSRSNAESLGSVGPKRAQSLDLLSSICRHSRLTASILQIHASYMTRF